MKPRFAFLPLVLSLFAASPVLAGADLAIHVRSSVTNAHAGDAVTFYADVTNLGPGALSGTEVVEIPLPFNVNPATASPDGWDDSLPGWHHTLPALPSGASETFNFSMTAPAVTLLTATARLIAPSDPIPGNNTASAKINVSGNYADAAIAIAGPPQMEADGTATFGVTVRNNGPNQAQPSGWTLTITGATFASPDFSQTFGRTSTCVRTIDFISCTFPLLLTGEFIDYHFGLKPAVPVGSAVTIRADLTADVLDPTPANNSATLSPVVTHTNPVLLTVSYVAPPVAPAYGAIPLVVTLHDESAAATNPHFTFTPQDGSAVSGVVQTDGPPFDCTVSSGTATCTGAWLDVGHNATFTVTVHLGAATGIFHSTIDIGSNSTIGSVPVNIPIGPARSRPSRH